MLDVQSSFAMLTLSADKDTSTQCASAEVPAHQKQALSTSERSLLRGDNVAAIWNEWQCQKLAV